MAERVKWSASDFEQVLETIHSFHRAGSITALFELGFPALTELIPNDLMVVSHFSATGEALSQFAHPEFPFTPDEIDFYQRHALEFPGHAFIRDNPQTKVFTLSDCLPLEAWKQHPIYLNCRSRSKLLYSLIAFQGEGGKVERAISLDRKDRDFTSRDRLMLTHLYRHIFLSLSRLIKKPNQRPWREPVLKDWLATELGVTNREAEVLSLLRLGLNNSELADRMRLSTGTVRKHLENIYRKLGVIGRLQAVRRVDELIQRR